MPALIDTTELRRNTRDSMHWYTGGGEARHQVPKLSGGGMRNANVTDARKLGLYPSVTSIFKVAAKPQLEKWKLNRVLEAAMEQRPASGENLESYARRCEQAGNRITNEAAKLGTYGHDAIDRSFEGTPVPPELLAIIEPFFKWKEETAIEITAREKVLVNPEAGYAGTVDILFTWGDKGQRVHNQGVLDFKFKNTVDDAGKPKKIFIPDDYGMQIAAYGVAHYGEQWLDNPNAMAANVFLSTTEPGRMEVKKWDNLRRHYEGFLGLLSYWFYTKRYDPRETVSHAS